MISRFFIDRPIFAMVVSVVITLVGLIALSSLPVAQYPQIVPPSVSISISYPGASAQVVADTVAAPIEQSVNGVQGMLYMSSNSGNDGSYSLSVTFEVGTDLNTALVMVQNRVTLAMPLLPSSVQNQGITVRKKTPDMLMIISLSTKDRANHDAIDLSNFALINLKDVLLRVDGVSDVGIMGQRDFSMRVWLDPDKLAARNMTASDVANAIRSQSIQVSPGQIGQPPAPKNQTIQLPLDTLGRLSDPDQFGNIIVKVDYGSTTPTPATTGGSSTTGSGLPNPGPSKSIAGSILASGTAGGGAGSGSLTSGVTTVSGKSVGSSTANPVGGTSSSLSGGTLGVSTGGGASSQGGANASGPATSGGVQFPNAAPGGPTSGASALTASDTTSGGLAGNLATQSGTIGSGATGGVLTTSDLKISGAQGPSPSLVRLKDVARIVLGAANYNQNATFDQKPAAGVTVFQLPGTNALDVANRVRAQVEVLKQDFPSWIECTIGYDTTPFISESINDVVNTLLLAVVLVGVVVLLFLQDWRAMILPMIDVPVSLIGTFAVMALLGYTLNNISLFGLVLAIGIVVDDAIVVLENIERQMAKGLDTRTATIKAMEEITGPIIAITLVLCAVFVPCAFIPGIPGRFFRQFAVTISASMIISAINAITMTPSRALAIFKSQEGQHGHEHKREALPWWFFGVVGGILSVVYWSYLPGHPPGLPELPSGEEEGQPSMPSWLYWAITAVHFLPGLLAGLIVGWFAIRPVNVALGWFFRLFNRLFDRLIALYMWTIGLALHASGVVLVVYVVLLGLTVWVLSQVHTGFVPQQDQGRLIGSVQLPDSSSLQRTQAVLEQMDTIAHSIPGVKHTITNAGSSFVAQANAPNVGSMFIILESFAERRNDPEKNAQVILNRLKQKSAAQIEEAKITINPAAPIPGLGVAGGFKLVVKDNSGLDPAELEKNTKDLVDKLNQQDGPKDVITTYRSATPQLLLTIDRAKAASLGVALADVNQTLQMYLGSVYVNSFNEFGRHWQVTVQAESRYRSQTEDIGRLQVRNNKGEMVPLGTLVNVVPKNGPLAVQRYNLRPAAAVTGNIAPGVSSGEVITIVEEVAQQLPATTGMEWTDQMFLQKQAGNGAMFVFGLAVLCVFLALAAQYESWTMPLAVILVVPLCVLCSLLAVRFTTNSVDIFVQIGLVVLVGLACKNSILVVEFAQQLHRGGLSRFAAAREASGQRLRPILMTSLAFIAGVVPLVVARGAGAEMRQSLGTAVFSGMIGVTLFGIFLTPVFFYVIQGIGDQPLFATVRSRRVVTTVVGGGVGAAFGGLLAGLGVGRLPWGPIVGAAAGALGALSVLGARQWVRFTTNKPEEG